MFLEGISCYNYYNGPMIEFCDVLDAGANCQLYAHILLEELGFSLPKYLRSREIFYERFFTRFLEQNEEPRIGDIYLFGEADKNDPMFFHLAIVIKFSSSGEPVLGHIIPDKVCEKAGEQTNQVEWPLSRFYEFPRYQLKARKRVLSSGERIEAIAKRKQESAKKLNEVK
ncbi:MAG: hypothetical protein ACOZAN_03775 [Patescibacteria group bacterium]